MNDHLHLQATWPHTEIFRRRGIVVLILAAALLGCSSLRVGAGDGSRRGDGVPDGAAFSADSAGRSDVGRSDVAPSDVAPSDVAPSDVAPSDVAPSDVAPSDVALSDVAPSDVALSDATGGGDTLDSQVPEPLAWTRLRGMVADTHGDEGDFAALAATGAKLVRLGLNKPRPLMAKEPPYTIDQQKLEKIDRILDWAVTHKFKVVLDPHTFPGMSSLFTIYPEDDFWTSYTYHDLAVRLWETLARRYAGRGAELAGYELMNEPCVPNINATNTPGSWFELIPKLITAIRKYDTRHSIIVSGTCARRPRWIDRAESFDFFPPPPDDNNLVYSEHTYSPMAFCLQGTPERSSGFRYPGDYGGVRWNKERLRAHMQPLREYSTRYNVPVFMSEFSATRYSCDDGVQWIRDVTDLYEEYGWSWTYFVWRAPNNFFDAEMSCDANDRTRRASTPRLDLLKSLFARNRD